MLLAKAASQGVRRGEGLGIDLKLAGALLRFLAGEYHVPWPIADAATRERVGRQVRSRLNGRLTDWTV